MASLDRGRSAFAAAGAARRGRVLACLRLGEAVRDRSATAARALADLASDGLEVVLALHPDDVPESVPGELRRAGVRLSPPVDYPDFVATMRDADVVVTDSAAVGEEAPGLGTPVLAVSDAADRGETGETVTAGTSRLVSGDADELVATCRRFVALAGDRLTDPATNAAPGNPFGDGRAADRVLEVIARSFLDVTAAGRPAVDRILTRRSRTEAAFA